MQRLRALAVGGMCVLLWAVAAAEEVAPRLAAAREHARRGRYDEALAAYAKMADEPALAAQAHLGTAEVRIATGKYDEADSACRLALKADPQLGRARNIHGELLVLRGRYDEAMKAFAKAEALRDDRLRARLDRAHLLEMTGKGDQAEGIFEGFIDLYNATDIEDPETLILVGRAALAYSARHPRSDLSDAVLNDLFLGAARKDPLSTDAHLWAGRLLLEKYNDREARDEFQAVLKINPHHAEAYLGLALAAVHGEDLDEAEGHLEKALRLNPALVPAQVLKAWLSVADGQYPAALAVLERALGINANDVEARSLQAAIYEQTGDRQRHAEAVKKVSAVDPASAVLYTTLGEVAEGNRRFAAAEEHYKRAIEFAPHRANAHTNLGLLHMRAGREAEAEPVLAKAFELDPYNARTLRVKRLLATLKSFAVVETDHFIFKFDERADRALGRIVPPTLEALYPAVCRRFGFEPARKTLVEVFPDHRGFSVRTTGRPWIGTIGACTGWVVALTSPRAVGEARFSWARVLEHEFTHIVTLQASDMRMPHWFTEGLAVSQEGMPLPVDWVALLAEAAEDDALIPIQGLDRAFTRPRDQRQRQLAYAQSEQVIDLIQARHGGETAIRTMIAAFKAGQSTDEAIRSCLSLEVADLERETRDYIRQAVAQSGVVPWMGRDPQRVRRDLGHSSDDIALMVQLAWALLMRGEVDEAAQQAEAILKKAPAHADALTILGGTLVAKDDANAAQAKFEAALKARPDHPQAQLYLAGLLCGREAYQAARPGLEDLARRFPKDPRVARLLASAYEALGEAARATAERERLVRLADGEIEAARTLAVAHTRALRYKEATEAWLTVVHIDPFDADAYVALADCRRRLGRTGEAIVALESADAVRGFDAAILGPLAEAYLAAGQADRARRTAELALRIDPGSAAARRVIEQLSRTRSEQ